MTAYIPEKMNYTSELDPSFYQRKAMTTEKGLNNQ